MGGDARCGYGNSGIMNAESGTPNASHLKRVEGADKVETDAVAEAQQLQRHHRLAVERHTIAEVERYVVIEHIDRILHLTLCVITTQHQEYHDGKCL